MTDDGINAIHEQWFTYAGPLEPVIAQVRTLLAEVERLRAREAQMCEIVQAVASLWVMDDCSNGNDFPQRRMYLYDRTDDGVPATDVAVVRDKARALLAGDDD